MNATVPRENEPRMAGAVPASGWREPAKAASALSATASPLTPALSPAGGEGEKPTLDPDPRPLTATYAAPSSRRTTSVTSWLCTGFTR